MAKKEVKTVMKLYLDAGKANPAPPVGPALSPTGIDVGKFCNQYNEMTKERMGYTVPVIITIYKDRSFDLETVTPPTSDFIRKELGISKGSGEPNLNKVGELNREQLEKIAKEKMVDLNTTDMDEAVKIIAGTAKQMGIKVKDLD
jgi:large subunit ribosomal protein L11